MLMILIFFSGIEPNSKHWKCRYWGTTLEACLEVLTNKVKADWGKKSKYTRS
jgi:hypothetical protein